MSLSDSYPDLYEGEILEDVSGYPTLYKFIPASFSSQQGPTTSESAKGHSLIVFIPGGFHLARIAYGGHNGSNARDFLAFWLSEAGYNVLAISYPMEMRGIGEPLIATSTPGFGLSDWGQQVAQTTRKVINEQHLGNVEVIVLGWSIGGRILRSLVLAAHECDLSFKLFVPLSGAPVGFLGLRASTPKVTRTAAGYAACPYLEPGFWRQIVDIRDADSRSEKSAIIDQDVYRHEYFGYPPVRLLPSDLTYCKANEAGADDSGFLPDPWDALRDGGPNSQEFSLYPFVGAIRPTSTSDMYHVLTDQASWGLVLTLKLTADVMKVVRNQATENADLQQILRLVFAAPAEFTETVRGNHFFFLGEFGAKETAKAIIKLWEKTEKMQDEMHELLVKL